MTAERPRRPQDALTVIAILIGATVFAQVWWNRARVDLDWKSAFSDVREVGSDCAYAIAPWNGEPAAELRQKPKALTPILAPFRRNTVVPEVHPEAFLLLRCRVDLSGSASDAWGWLALGRVFGVVSVFVDGTPKSVQNDDGFAHFPLTPAEQRKDALLEIVARRSDRSDRVGPVTLAPFFFAKDRRSLARVEHLNWSGNIEAPMLYVGFALATFIVFGVSWLFGIRYRDVEWMVVLSASLALLFWLDYTPHGFRGPQALAVGQVVRQSTLLAMSFFLAAFLRFESKRLPLGLVFTILVVFLAALNLLVPRDILALAWMPARLPLIFAAMASAGLGWAGWRHSRTLSGTRRLRVKVISVTALLAGGAFAAQAVLSATHGFMFENFLVVGFVTAFSTFLAVDLVTFHRQFFDEKARRIEGEDENTLLESRLELGRAVQQHLLPKTMRETRNGIDYAFFYEPSQGMSGDWLVSCIASDQTLQLFIGDVVGKGPQAAISVAAIVATLKDAQSDNLDLLSRIGRVNDVLFDLFGGHVTTTVAAVAVPADRHQKVELLSAGSVGWLHATREGIQVRRVTNSLIGSERETSFESMFVELQTGERLLTYTDGVIDGSQGLRSFKRRFDGRSALEIDAEGLFRAAVDSGRTSALEDDKALLLLTRV